MLIKTETIRKCFRWSLYTILIVWWRFSYLFLYFFTLVIIHTIFSLFFYNTNSFIFYLTLFFKFLFLRLTLRLMWNLSNLICILYLIFIFFTTQIRTFRCTFIILIFKRRWSNLFKSANLSFWPSIIFHLTNAYIFLNICFIYLFWLLFNFI